MGLKSPTSNVIFIPVKAGKTSPTSNTKTNLFNFSRTVSQNYIKVSLIYLRTDCESCLCAGVMDLEVVNVQFMLMLSVDYVIPWVEQLCSAR